MQQILLHLQFQNVFSPGIQDHKWSSLSHWLITAATISFPWSNVRGGSKEDTGGKDGIEATALYLATLITDSERSSSPVVFGLA